MLARESARVRVYDEWLNGAPAGRIEVAGEPALEDRRVTRVPHLRLPTLPQTAPPRPGHRAAARDPPPVRRGELPPPLALGNRTGGRQRGRLHRARKGAGIAADGPQRARPGATAILVGLHRGDGQERIEAAIWPASAAGVSGDQARPFDWPPAGLGGAPPTANSAARTSATPAARTRLPPPDLASSLPVQPRVLIRTVHSSMSRHLALLACIPRLLCTLASR